MSKTLKLAFAMGGGVSLGSFSGAGLAEAIKQAVLNAGYEKDGQFVPYDNVVLDVFSGASAGSMSLAIMLRGLAHQSDRELADATAQLMQEGIDLAAMPQKKREALVAAQVVKNLQYQIWVKEINMDRLLGTTDAQQEHLKYEAGLVRRGALEDIAARYFDMKDAFNANFSRRQILADEVIFASTLSSLTGTLYDVRKEGKDHPNFIGSRDYSVSRCHKELRVFHLHFKEVTPEEITQQQNRYPSKWIRYHLGEKVPSYVSALKSKTAWARMVSTSMACGAFPFAFEPVTLERYQFEYDKDTFAKNGLTPEICTLAMQSDTPQQEGHLSYPFTYVDGGTFNNEPVREAFRMAGFLDAEDESDFDRLVVFVDPNTGSDEQDLRLPFLQRYAVEGPRRNFTGILDGHKTVRSTTLDRLLPHLGTVINMLAHEGSVKESNKMLQLASLFDKKESYYDVFEKLLTNDTDTVAALNAVIQPIKEILHARQETQVIPSGALTVKGELKRICKHTGSRFHHLMPHIDTIARTEDYNTLPADLRMPALRALLTIFTDQLLDLSGKNEQYKIIAIAPVKFVDGIFESQDLPGSPLAAFAGFASERANEYAIDLAEYLARNMMQRHKMLPQNMDIGAPPDWTSVDQLVFKTDFSSKMMLMKERIDVLLQSSHIINMFPVLDGFILSKISNIIKNYLDSVDFSATPDSFMFMVQVDNDNLDMDGDPSRSDISAIKTEDGLCLVTELLYYKKAYKDDHGTDRHWKGAHAQEDRIRIETDGLLRDHPFCTLALPDKDMVKKAKLMPFPIFTYKLTNADKNKNLPASAWKLKPGVVSAEQHILGKLPAGAAAVAAGG